MTEEQLKAIEARLNAITPGKWVWYDGELWTEHERGQYQVSREVLRLENCGDYDNEPSIEGSEADMDFITAAPDDIRELLAEVRRLQKEVKRKNTALYPFAKDGFEGQYNTGDSDETEVLLYASKWLRSIAFKLTLGDFRNALRAYSETEQS